MSYESDSLGNRMKSYESVFRMVLPIRMPVILRLDGKAFHSYTRGCKRPFDENLVNVMNETALYLCKNVQGAKLAYVQSDEISILLNNYEETTSQSWFDNNLEKMISVSAGMASAKFSLLSDSIFGKPKMAVFDSRAFILPKEEVVNYFIWRQSDATRNSIQMLARTLYSHKELIGVDCDQLQELCFQKGINWNDCPVPQKRGRCAVKIRTMKTGFNPKLNMEFPALRSEWVIDNEMPIFTQDRNYVNRFV